MTEETNQNNSAATTDIKTQCGFVTLIGAPNAGKSTLLNHLVGAKVSIVTPKVQTTRTMVRGIALYKKAQIIFVDTPGIFRPKKKLEKAMVRAAWQGTEETDQIALLVDAKKGITDEVKDILEALENQKRKAVLLLNKVDLVKKEVLLPLSEDLFNTGLFDHVFMISATTGHGVEAFMDHLVETLPHSPWYYPEDQLSDLPQRLLAAEVTREKLFLKLYQELPYDLTVETEDWKQTDKGIRIEQTVYVRRPSQKQIVLGKAGQMIKQVGQASREDLSEMFDMPVHLFLHVKVRENWQDTKSHYAAMGLDFPKN